MASTDARPVPLKGSAFRVYFEILDLLGDGVTSAAGLDSEVSKDGGAFADCTNEATEIGQGEYYLELTSTEMNADCVVVIVKTSTTNAKTTRIKLYPQEADDIKASVTYWGASAIATPDTAGCPQVTVKSGTGTGELSVTSGVVSANITQCGGSAVAAGAIPNAAAATSGGLITAGSGSGQINPSSGSVTVTSANQQSIAQQVWARTTIGEVQGSYGEYVAQIQDAATSAGVVVAASSKTGYSLASGAITSAAIADGAITSAKFTVGALTGFLTGLLERMSWLYHRFGDNTQHDLDAEQLKVYNGSTLLSTQSVVVDDDAQTETQGRVS